MIASIRLNKQTKTIRVVNRPQNIRLARTQGANIRLQHAGHRGPSGTLTVGTTTTVDPDIPASVTNSGSSTAAVFDFQIPKGDKGDTGESTFVRVHHGSNPNVARPNAQFVEWVGTVQPNAANLEDTWIHTPVV